MLVSVLDPDLRPFLLRLFCCFPFKVFDLLYCLSACAIVGAFVYLHIAEVRVSGSLGLLLVLDVCA